MSGRVGEARGELRAVRDAELRVDVREARLHRAAAHEQTRADLGVRQAFGDEPHDLELGGGEALPSVAGAPPRAAAATSEGHGLGERRPVVPRGARVGDRGAQARVLLVGVGAERGERLESAIAQARAAAGDKDVAIATPGTVRQCVEAGVLDELQVNVVPVVLGAGPLFFEGIAAQVDLDGPEVVEGTGVTHLRHRLKRGDTVGGDDVAATAAAVTQAGR
jgi:hypothetical protein